MRKKFEIPKHFELLGKDFTVKRTMDLLPKSNNGVVGQILHDFGTIELQGSSPTYPVSEDSMNETYLHEVTHAILSAMESKLTSDEKFVNLFAKHLYQVLKTSDYSK